MEAAAKVDNGTFRNDKVKDRNELLDTLQNKMKAYCQYQFVSRKSVQTGKSK